MFTVEFEGKKIKVKFRHEQKGHGKRFKFYTFCSVSIEDLRGNIQEFQGSSQRNPVDRICKNYGKKVALIRAMGEIIKLEILSKEERTKIWEEFFANFYGSYYCVPVNYRAVHI